MEKLELHFPLNFKTKLYLQAYILMLHLVSRGCDTYANIIDFLFWGDLDQKRFIDIVEYIDKTIYELRENWGEDIPSFQHLAFQELTPEQKNEYASKNKSFEKWDQVLEVFRKNAYNKL